MVDRAISDVVLVHHVYDAHYGLWVVGGVAVYLHVEDVPSPGQVVVWGLHLSLVQGSAMVVYGHVVGVGVVVPVRYAGYDAELLAVDLREPA